MNRRLLTMGALALVFGGMSVGAADFWLRQNVRTVVETVPAAAPEVPAVTFGTIVVAAEPLRYGATLETHMLRTIPWPDDSVPEGAFADIGSLLDEGPRAVLEAIEPNEPILSAKVTGPDGRPTLSNRLEQGKRAVTIPVNRVTGVAGFVVPGDRVDIVLIQQLGDLGGVEGGAISASATPLRDQQGGLSFTTEGGAQVSALTVLENVRVLSVDQIADERRSEPVVVASVTLELSPSEARTISAAQSAGVIALHLRKAGEGTEPVGVLPQFGIDPQMTASYEPERPSGVATVRVRHGDRTETFTVPDEGSGQ